MNVYFDNAATTAIDPQVIAAIQPMLSEQFGNPSSIHAHGRKVRSIVEVSRKRIWLLQAEIDRIISEPTAPTGDDDGK